MGTITDITEYQPHLTGELICLHCGYRYIGSWVETVWLKNLYCPNCNEQGWTIATGQILESRLADGELYCDAEHPFQMSKPGKIIEFKPNISGQEVQSIIKLNKDENEEV